MNFLLVTFLNELVVELCILDFNKKTKESSLGGGEESIARSPHVQQYFQLLYSKRPFKKKLQKTTV